MIYVWLLLGAGIWGFFWGFTKRMLETCATHDSRVIALVAAALVGGWVLMLYLGGALHELLFVVGFNVPHYGYSYCAPIVLGIMIWRVYIDDEDSVFGTSPETN